MNYKGNNVMRHKSIFVLLLLLILLTSLTGCGMELVHGMIREYEDNKEGIKSELQELKDGFKKEINDWMGSVSRYSLTADENLKGDRKFGTDIYVGTYEAEYSQFNGEEYIFGSTSLGLESGSTLKVIYSLSIQSGTATLYWLESEEEHIISGDKEKHVIAEVTAVDVCEFTVDAGDNFIVLKGNDFTGNLSLEVE